MGTTAPIGTSLEDLRALVGMFNPHLLDLWGATTREDFQRAVELTLQLTVSQIESGAKLYSALEEPGLSKLTCDLLTARGVTAEAEAYNNGHVDLSVKQFGRCDHRYLGEFKIYDGFKYHVSACSQLLGYCTGREGRGFVLDFYVTPRMYKRLEKLRADFDARKPALLKGASAPHPSIQGGFLTLHEHDSGADLAILHLGCNMHVPGGRSREPSEE